MYFLLLQACNAATAHYFGLSQGKETEATQVFEYVDVILICRLIAPFVKGTIINIEVISNVMEILK